jgi:hypothetical protein
MLLQDMVLFPSCEVWKKKTCARALENGPIPKGDARDVFLTRYGDTVFLTRTDAACRYIVIMCLFFIMRCKIKFTKILVLSCMLTNLRSVRLNACTKTRKNCYETYKKTYSFSNRVHLDERGSRKSL